MVRKILTAALVLGSVAWPVWAQSPAPQQPVKTIVDYRPELKLTDAQIEQIRSVVKDFQTQLLADRQKAEAAEKQVSQLMAQHAPIEQIAVKLREAENDRMTMRYLDVVTSRKIEGVLSSAQLKQWKDIQARVRAGGR